MAIRILLVNDKRSYPGEGLYPQAGRHNQLTFNEKKNKNREKRIRIYNKLSVNRVQKRTEARCDGRIDVGVVLFWPAGNGKRLKE